MVLVITNDFGKLTTIDGNLDYLLAQQNRLAVVSINVCTKTVIIYDTIMNDD